MESVLPAFVVVLIMLFAWLVPVQSLLSAQDRIQFSQQAMESRLLDRARTNLETVKAKVNDEGSLLDLVVENTGQSKLADFDQWDLILQYYDGDGGYQVVWLPYLDGDSPAENTWTLLDISDDFFEPGILNPGETMHVRVSLSPDVGPLTTNQVAVTTGDGIGVSAIFIGPPLPPTPTSETPPAEETPEPPPSG
jgi:hypothetical protein